MITAHVLLPHESACHELYVLSDTILKIINKDPKVEVVLAGDFNIHNTTWLRHSNKISNEGRYVEIFSKKNMLSQLVQEPKRIPDLR